MSLDTKYDLLLKEGKIIDPANKRNHRLDLAVKDGKIAAVGPDIQADLADQVLDVSGLYVTPGLIDIHVHVYHTREPEGLSVVADHHSFRSGVTTVVDAGTAGAKHFLHFKRTVIDAAKTRILAFVNIVKSGMEGDFEQDIEEMDPELAASIVLAYPEHCVGIKPAHYWTHQPVDDQHPLWFRVDEQGHVADHLVVAGLIELGRLDDAVQNEHPAKAPGLENGDLLEVGFEAGYNRLYLQAEAGMAANLRPFPEPKLPAV